MKIGIVADTHSRELPPPMLKDFQKVDLIIHAGDFCSMEDFKALAKIKNVEAVHGNMDESEIKRLLPRRKIIDLESLKIGLFHGEGAPQMILETVQKEFKDDKVDVVIFGHSHQPLNELRNGILFFNPGSPNDMIFAPYCSYGLMEIVDGQPMGKIIKVK